MREIKFANREIIFKEGDLSGKMYQIRSGKVEIVAKYGTELEQQLAILKAGKFFGEMGVIENAPRSATAVAETDVELIELDADDFPKFIANNATDALDMMANLSKRLRKTTTALLDAQKTVEKYVGAAEEKKTSLWQKLVNIASKADSSQQAVEAAAKAAAMYNLKAGDIVFKKGQKGNNMFKVLEGEIAFYLNYGKDNQIELGKSGKGEIFGEMAVIEEERRSATAVAVCESKLKSVASTELLSYIEDYPEDAVKILKNISKKLRSTTAEYMEVLAVIAECVKDEKNEISDYGVWDRFVEYSKVYNEYSGYGLSYGYNQYGFGGLGSSFFI